MVSIAQGILDSVLSSSDKMPLALKNACEIMWDAVEDALSFAESILGLSFNDSSPSPKGKEIANNDFIHFDDAFEAAMAIHTLQLGVVYYTHVGKARAATPRLHHLHALLDSDSLNHFATGTLEVIFFVTSSAMHLLN